MKVMVLGAEGMLGHMVATVLDESGHEVISVSRTGRFGRNPLAVNLEDWDTLARQLVAHEPQWLVNAAGLLNDVVDKRLPSAITVNSLLPHQLAASGIQLGYRTITVGSDCVFEGDRGGYTVLDIPDARSAYGRTKQLGEVRNDRDLTIRTSIVGPEVSMVGRGLLKWLVSQEGATKGWSSAIWTGVTTLELAKAIEAQVAGTLDETGIWQFVPSVTISKAELVGLMNTVFLDGRLTIQRVPGTAHDRSLINDRPASWSIPSYSAMLEELQKWVRDHQMLYQGTVFEFPYGIPNSIPRESGFNAVTDPMRKP